MKKILAVIFLATISLVRIVHAQTGNRTSNFSFEVADSRNSNHAAAWQTYGGDYQRVTGSNVWDQNYMLKLTAGGGAVQRIYLNQTTANPVRISVRVKGENIGNDPSDSMGASLDCKIGYHDGSNAWCPTGSGVKNKSTGTFDWKLVGYNTANLSSTTTPIDWIDVRVRVGAVSGTAWFDDVQVEEWPPTTNGLVTFMFDDSLLSTYTKGYPMLKAAGFVGTAAVVTNYLAFSDHMSISQLRDLYNHGWSVVSHTIDHQDLTTLSPVDLNDELYWSQKFLIDNGFPVRHLAVPYGAYNGQVVARSQEESYQGFGYMSVRTTDRDVNPQGVFPYNIRIQEIDSNIDADDVANWVAKAKQRKAWLVLVLHEIDNPNGIYTVTSPTLKKMIDVVASSGLPVVTYDNGFNRMTGN